MPGQSLLRRAAAAAIAAAFLAPSAALAQGPGLMGSEPPKAMWPLLRDDQLPGTVGRVQLQRDCRLQGYFQPVQILAPEGVEISFAEAGFFGESVPQPASAGLLVGVPYRIKLTGIPFNPEAELFPTIELIDRTYPPPEKAHRFPVPIAIDAADIDAALRGELVTRVVYLEDSQNAEPVSYAGPHRVYESPLGEDMLQTADYFGRPLAILRIGSRVPADIGGPAAEHFLFGSPPVAPLKPLPDAQSLYEQGIFRRYEPQSVAPDASAAPATPQ